MPARSTRHTRSQKSRRNVSRRAGTQYVDVADHGMKQTRRKGTSSRCGMLSRIVEELLLGTLTRVRAWRRRTSIAVLESSISRLQEEQRKLKLAMEAKLTELENRNGAMITATTTENKKPSSSSIFLSTVDPNVIQKYEKMLTMGIPEGAVRQKVKQDGLDPHNIFVTSEEPLVVASRVPYRTLASSCSSALAPTTKKLPIVAPRPNITVDDITRIRGSLKATTITTPVKVPFQSMEFVYSASAKKKVIGLRDITNVVPETPAEFLRTALNQKFAYARSPVVIGPHPSPTMINEFM